MSTASSRLLPLAVLGEGALALAGGVWLWLAGYPVSLGATPAAVTAGVGCAAGLSAIQWWLQRHAPGVGPIPYLRELRRTWFQPLFAPLSLAEMAAISALAGVGEEIFFRGALQSAFGWPAATIAFGLCHVGPGGRGWILVAWATAAGAVLAWLAAATGGLLAPIVAHAGYDLAALIWIRREARRTAGSPGSAGGSATL
jgi:membrane protease YdiL (CAAX protease family)